ncbi:sensor domain-containing diguanylate cyclase [Vibrio sp. VPAP30]|uniref:sensor domain-containing diguanylate cyclase n=1 Tax=Vibrio sp. VPAP30 TaxID=1647102 RepID=UPI0006599928|nr:sensor domain-containing diguanylate cyclase [Vibrio sp. VPAP30]KLN62818.1 diguanylate cyclase [Vibrio sp. VPAP30]
MSHLELLNAHREVNKLLAKLALGMGKEELNRRVVNLSETWFGERRTSILRLEPKTKTLYLEYAPSLPQVYNDAVEGIEIGPNVGSCGAAAFHKKTVVVEDINQHSNWVPFTDLAHQANLRACWSVPILSSEQTAMGTFAIYSSEPSAPAEHELEVLEMLAALYAVAWEKYQLEDKLYYQARYDPLTKCLNRFALLQQAQDCLNTDLKYISCFFADIDQFKLINDRYGHEVGDKVLSAVGDLLNRTFKGCSLKGRYGGDEFVVFSFSDSKEVFAKLEETFNRQLKSLSLFEGLTISVSVGKSVCEVNRLTSLQILIKQADQQMYRVKHSRRHDRDQGKLIAEY